MIFFRIITLFLALFFISIGPSNLFADSHDAEQNIVDQAKEINKEIKKKFPKNKIIIYSPSLKRSGKKIKKYNCLNRKDFLIKKEFKNGVMLLEKQRF